MADEEEEITVRLITSQLLLVHGRERRKSGRKMKRMDKSLSVKRLRHEVAILLLFLYYQRPRV